MALTLGGIIGACGLFCGFLSWVLMCPGHPRDPEADTEEGCQKKKQKNGISR